MVIGDVSTRSISWLWTCWLRRFRHRRRFLSQHFHWRGGGYLIWHFIAQLLQLGESQYSTRLVQGIVVQLDIYSTTCDHFGTTLGPLCDHFVTTLWPLCDHFVTTLQIYILRLQLPSNSTHLRTDEGIICSAGAASIRFCHVLVDPGITYPNSKNHSEIRVWNIIMKVIQYHVTKL